MNYLKREEELRRAISNACEGKSNEVWKKESGIVLNAIHKIMDLMMEKRMRDMERRAYMDVFGKEDESMASEDPDQTIIRVKEQMRIINSMCSKYGTEPMFPEAMGKADPKTIENAYRTYERQCREVA